MWACFITVAAAHIPSRSPLGAALLLLGAFAPGLAALALTARAEGGAGARALLARVAPGRVAARWYGFALGYTAAIKLTAALLQRLFTGAWPRFGDTSLLLMPLAIAVSTPFQAGEELGWRGYALPRLAARFGLGPASLLLGLVWALWHLPQFFITDGDTSGQSFPVFVLQVTALSVAMAWLWENTGRTLLLPMLMHAAVNNSKDIVPSAVAGATDIFTFRSSLVAWLTVALLWLGAAILLAAMARTESRRHAAAG